MCVHSLNRFFFIYGNNMKSVNFIISCHLWMLPLMPSDNQSMWIKTQHVCLSSVSIISVIQIQFQSFHSVVLIEVYDGFMPFPEWSSWCHSFPVHSARDDQRYVHTWTCILWDGVECDMITFIIVLELISIRFYNSSYHTDVWSVIVLLGHWNWPGMCPVNDGTTPLFDG